MVHQSNWYLTDGGYLVAIKTKQMCQRDYMGLIVPLTVIKVRSVIKIPGGVDFHSVEWHKHGEAGRQRRLPTNNKLRVSKQIIQLCNLFLYE